MQLHWTHQAQFAGYYVAEQLGFYKGEGIDIELAPGGLYVEPMTVLGIGATDVAIGWISGAIDARHGGADVVNIAQVFKRASIRLVCWRAAGITHTSDIKGKTIGVWNIGDEYNVLSWLRRHGRTASDVYLVQQRADAADFLARTIDCATVTTYNEYLTILKAGVAPSDLFIVSFSDDRYGLLEDGLYVQGKTLQDASKRDHLARFLRASAQGWRYASQHREEAVTITKLYAPLADTARERAMLDAILQLIDLDDRFGLLDLNIFERSVQTIAGNARDPRSIEMAARHGWTHRIWYAAQPHGSERNLLTAAVQHDLRKIIDSTWFYVLVLVGIASFGLSGFMQAHKLHYDLWGAFLLTLLPALGGGILRDLLIAGERQPLFIFSDPAFLYTILSVATFGVIMTRILPPAAVQSKAYTNTKTLVDTIGFATLTVLGAKIALIAGLTWYWVPICAAISCAGGGIMLAMVTVQQPRTLQGEPYEEISVGGGLFMLGGLMVANHFEHSPWIVAATICATLIGVFATRLAVVHYGWRSYRLR
jgi:uncharacterized membrane protein YeiH/ABC-type nitrate/sulfonate/bicarbonate transport system substrate-binding protein